MVLGFPLFSAFSSIHDALHSTAFTIALSVVASLAVVFWLGLAFWVFKDARRRIVHPVLVGPAALVGLVPLLGPLVYLLLRPPETLDEVRARDAELHALERELLHARSTCPVCGSAIEFDYIVCPVCASTIESAHEDLDAVLAGVVRDVVQDGFAPPTPLRRA